MPPTAPGIRARNRAALEAEILAVAQRHLARDGAAALSLRAVARELGMASSAVYRYVASRDDLLTLLIVQAYDSLGDAVEVALAGAAQGAPRERFQVICRTVRAWSAAHPHQFALVYGSPVPGYHAPAERTNPAGTRVTDRLLAALVEIDRGRPDAVRRGERGSGGRGSGGRGSGGPGSGGRPGRVAVGTLTYDPALARAGLPAELVARGLAAWTLVLGAITAERFEQFGPDAIADPDAHFEAMLELALSLVA